MRITNGMTVNNLLLNLNKSMTTLDKLQYQTSTGNKIRYPSDDPIVAGRALKFRTNVAETEQFISNTKQGKAWMDTSELAFKNIEEIMQKIRELGVQASSDICSTEDRQKIVTVIDQLAKEVTSEINVTYAGRYVFSGFRTDEPMLFPIKNTRQFEITQMMSGKDIEQVAYYEKMTPPTPAKEGMVDRVLLAYQGIDPASLSYLKREVTDLEVMDSTDAGARDMSGATVPRYFADTKEVLYPPYPNSDPTVPKFDSSTLNLRVDPPTIDALIKEPITDIKLSTDLDAYDMSTAGAPRFIQDTGELLFPAGFNKAEFGGAIYSKAGFAADEMNPVNYFDCMETMLDGTTKSYNMNNQIMYYEMGTNNKMQVNSLGMNVATADFLSEMRDIVRLVTGTTPSDGAGVTTDYVDKEELVFRSVLHDRFSKLIKKMDTYLANNAKENAELGARINRVDFIEARLQDDRLNFISLRDDNELVDMAEALIMLNAAQSVYQAALSTGANIIQRTLVDFV